MMVCGDGWVGGGWGGRVERSWGMFSCLFLGLFVRFVGGCWVGGWVFGCDPYGKGRKAIHTLQKFEQKYYYSGSGKEAEWGLKCSIKILEYLTTRDYQPIPTQCSPSCHR